MIARRDNSGGKPAEACWQVIAAMTQELIRQQRHGQLYRVGKMNPQAQLELDGTLDLAALADAAEQGLREAFRRT